jgi:hypothetical protein
VSSIVLNILKTLPHYTFLITLRRNSDIILKAQRGEVDLSNLACGNECKQPGS